MTCSSSSAGSFPTRTSPNSRRWESARSSSPECPPKTSSITSGGMLANAETQANREAMLELVAELKQKHDIVRQGGGEEVRKRHTSRGKMFVRDRIAALLDSGTPFLEFSALAANGMYRDEAPGAGIVTGMGTIQGHRAV